MINTLNRILESLGRMSGDSLLAKGGIFLLSFISNLFLPIVPVVLTCFGISLVDLYYGLKVAKVNKAKIESKRTWNGTIMKMRDTLVILTAARGIELYVLGGLILTALVGGFATVICLTELWSILENLNTINPKGPWRILGKFMKKKGQDITGVNIDEIDEFDKNK